MSRSPQPAHAEDRSDRPAGWRAGLHSLQFKASALVVLLIVTLVTSTHALSLRAMSAILHEDAVCRTQQSADLLALGASSAVALGDRDALQRTAHELVNSHGIVSVAFADASGEVLAAAAKTTGQAAPFTLPHQSPVQREPLQRPTLRHDPRLDLRCIDITVPVYNRQQAPPASPASPPVVAGYLRLVTDISDAGARLGHFAARLTQIGLAVVLLVVPCSLLVTRYVVSPLNELARTARAIAAGAIQERAQVDSRTEIGELAESFNAMADRVAQSQTEWRRLNAELEQRVIQRTRDLEELASRDPLTSLYNRRYFSDVMTHEFAGAERYDSDLTVLMFDVDHFKQTNDQFGHRTGDEVLVTLAEAVRSQQRESDVAARFGGDEFILLLPQTSAGAASALADRIMETFAREVTARFPGVPATLSVGIASLRTTRAASAEALIHEADLALYAAKETGRNRAVKA